MSPIPCLTSLLADRAATATLAPLWLMGGGLLIENSMKQLLNGSAGILLAATAIAYCRSDTIFCGNKFQVRTND